jgi:hypothetical protein
MTYGRLRGLPFVVVTTCDVVFVDTLTKRQSLRASLDRCVYVTHRCHNRRVTHQLFDLHHVNTGMLRLLEMFDQPPMMFAGRESYRVPVMR